MLQHRYGLAGVAAERQFVAACRCWEAGPDSCCQSSNDTESDRRLSPPSARCGRAPIACDWSDDGDYDIVLPHRRRGSRHGRRRGTTGPGGMETQAAAETSSAMGASAHHGLARTNPAASIRLQENGSMPHLFSPFALGTLRLANRIVIAPMCQYSAEDGKATDWHLIHLGHLALSGAGLMIIEATAVEPEGRISPADLGLWSDDNEAALARVLGAVRRYSPMPIAIQLGHAGRKASSHVPWEGGQLIPVEQGGWLPVAPSAITVCRACSRSPTGSMHKAKVRARVARASRRSDSDVQETTRRQRRACTSGATDRDANWRHGSALSNGSEDGVDRR